MTLALLAAYVVAAVGLSLLVFGLAAAVVTGSV